MQKRFFIAFAVILTIVVGHISMRVYAKHTFYEEEVSAVTFKEKLDACRVSARDVKSEYIICAKREVPRAIKDFSARMILAAVEKNFMSEDNAGRIYCHDIAHEVGRELARRARGSIQDTLSQCDATCNNGCFHGVLQEALLSLPQHTALKNLYRLCEPLFFHSPASETECFHGLGHGIMSLTKNNLQKSLGICDSLFFRNDRELCYSGAFMEGLVDTLHGESAVVDPAHALSLCKTLDATYQGACYLVLGSAGLGGGGQDFAWAFTRCDNEVPEEYQENCYMSVGYQIGVQKKWEVASSMAVCHDAKAHQKSGCYLGLISDFLKGTRTSHDVSQICGRIESEYWRMCQTQRVYSWIMSLPLYI